MGSERGAPDMETVRILHGRQDKPKEWLTAVGRIVKGKERKHDEAEKAEEHPVERTFVKFLGQGETDE